MPFREGMKGAGRRLFFELLCSAAEEDDKRKKSIHGAPKLLHLTEKTSRQTSRHVLEPPLSLVDVFIRQVKVSCWIFPYERVGRDPWKLQEPTWGGGDWYSSRAVLSTQEHSFGVFWLLKNRILKVRQASLWESGIVQPGEDKAPGRSYKTFQYQKGLQEGIL